MVPRNECHAGILALSILDQGEGFVWTKYSDFSPESAFGLHGRGIAMPRDQALTRAANAVLPGFPRSTSLPFVLLAAAILALTVVGIGYTFIQQRDKEVARLQTIADLKSRQIVDWLTERKREAGYVPGSQLWQEAYRRWREAGDEASRDQLRARLDEYREQDDFQDVMMLEEGGELLWSARGAQLTLSPALREAVRQSVGDRAIVLLGPYRDAAGQMQMDFIAPLPGVNGRPGLAIVFRTDPAEYLFSALQTWPVPSASGETLLLRRDGDQALFLNELRHLKDTAMKLRIPLARKNVLAARILRGETSPGGLVEGQDYRGVAAMGVAQAIPGTDWFLVAKMDRAELYDEAVRDAIWIGLAGLLALFMAAAGLYLLRQRQQLVHAEVMQQSQAERLRVLNLLGAIADSSDDAIFAQDLEGRYILFNRAASNFVGKPAEDVLGRDDRAIFPAEQAERLMAVARQVIADNRAITQEEVLGTPHGERVFLGTTGPLRDTDGKVIGIFGIARDITGRKQAELALRESEQRFHDIVRASADWIWEVDAEGRYTYVSESVRELLGYTPEEILGKTPFDFMPPEEVARVGAQFAAISARREAFRDLDNINRHKDGSLRHVQTNGMPILDADGKLLGYRGLDRDITAQRTAKESLYQQAEELRQHNAELERFNRATVGRELDMIALKQQVNALSRQLGEEPPYPLAFLEGPSAQPKGGGAHDPRNLG